jgi:tetratricopeptide (TPR) repeat protein
MISEAIEEYEAVLQIKQDHYVAMLRLARAYAEEDKWDLAAGAYDKLIQQRPESVEPYVELSRVYVQQKRWTEAISLLESASTRVSQNPLILLALGNCWASRSDLDKAAEYWQKALEQDPSFEPALNHRAGLRESEIGKSAGWPQGEHSHSRYSRSYFTRPSVG